MISQNYVRFKDQVDKALENLKKLLFKTQC